MEIQDQMLLQYFIFLKEEEKEEEARTEKLVKAVNDWYIGKGI